MGAGEASAPTAGYLQPHKWREAYARRPRSGHRQAVLPHPPSQALARVPRPPQGSACPLDRGEAVCGAGQLLPAQTHTRPRLDGRPPSRAGLPADPKCLAWSSCASSAESRSSSWRRPTGGSPRTSGALRPLPGPSEGCSRRIPASRSPTASVRTPTFEVHVGDCRIARWTKPVPAIEARRLPTENVEACQVCRPDSEPGMLDQGARTTQPDTSCGRQ
ncbi:DUF6233 domain-containing protein [Streptomyces sp. NPDC049597]|uniref:DUF6233 domain-containing protein n=1 Tax=Streptomyces sp. NPDC049597 TaxID=3155276 RepID=UPI00343A3FEA